MKKIILISLILFISSISFALDSLESQKLLNFAKELYDSGDYLGAAYEYQRFVSYYPNSTLSEEALFMSGLSYLKAKKTNYAVKIFDLYISEYPESPRCEGALFKIAESYSLTKQYDAWIYKLNEIKNQNSSQKFKDTCEYLIGWGYLSKHLFPEAKSIFYYLGTREGEYKLKAEGLAFDLENSNNLPSKSPFLAGAFSVVLPGSGQIYAERFYDGIVSFILNASFFYLSYEGFRSGNNSTGLFFGVIELGWYSSNIYSAINSSHKYNRNVKKDFVEGLKKKYEFPF